jgi:hypothetical protein
LQFGQTHYYSCSRPAGGKEDFELIKDESDRDGWKLTLIVALAVICMERLRSAKPTLADTICHLADTGTSTQSKTYIKEHFAKTIKMQE